MTQTTDVPELPCKTCLKYPVCKQKEEITCQDALKWLYYDGLDVFPGTTITEVEKYFGRELSMIKNNSFVMKFKKEKDHHSCMIVKNM